LWQQVDGIIAEKYIFKDIGSDSLVGEFKIFTVDEISCKNKCVDGQENYFQSKLVILVVLIVSGEQVQQDK